MRIHILGICGTFMSGVAILAKQMGHEVSGSDANVYPPMSTQLSNQGIELIEGFEVDKFDPTVDCVIVGNVIKRGNPIMEFILNNQVHYTSGPAWLYDNVLHDRWVLGVAGTHGKTTTSSLLAWILECAGLKPGFLIGGIPENFGVSARLGEDPFFVIEADEYDSAFFDKRSKFIHYHAKTLILNNLEFDHADIFNDLAAIKQQFTYLIKTIPSEGLILVNAKEENLRDVLQKGCWTPVSYFGNEQADWQANISKPDGSVFEILRQGKLVGKSQWLLSGRHNVDNALAAVAASCHAGANEQVALAALQTFKNVKRRMEIKAKVKEITIYDDFAHHPTAIHLTLEGLRARIGKEARLIAILEFGSYTMRSGVHKERMQGALEDADMIVFKSTEQDWGLEELVKKFHQPTTLYADVNSLVTSTAPQLRAGDHVVIMSNSGFDGIHNKLINELNARV